MSEWKEYKLGDLADITPGFAFQSCEFGEVGEYVVKIKDITPPFVDIRDAEKVDIGTYPEHKLDKYKLDYGDYIIAMTGATIGKIGKLKERKTIYINQRVAKVKAKKGVNNDFIYYSILTEDFQSFIQNNIDSNSAQENISGTSIGRFPIHLPPLLEQKSIASILSSLDDKIDLLHRQNATLEKMAETLFRQWFVEEAKEEWEEIPLYDAIELVGGGTPKTTVNEYWDGNIKWLSGGDIACNHKNFVVSSEKSITELGLKNSSAKRLPKFSTVISARGTVGKYCLLSEPMAYSQSNYGILPKYKDCFFFTYLLVAHSVDELQSAAYGSVFDTITTNTFKGISISLPKEENIIQFEEAMKPYFSKILTNQTQIRTLTALRDTLLPKLMSGEVKVDI